MELEKETLRMLKELDVKASQKQMTERSNLKFSDEIALAGLHKARFLSAKHFTEEELEASKKWLKDHEYTVPDRE